MDIPQESLYRGCQSVAQRPNRDRRLTGRQPTAPAPGGVVLPASRTKTQFPPSYAMGSEEQRIRPMEQMASQAQRCDLRLCRHRRHPSTKKLRPRPVPPAMRSSRAETSQSSASGAARWALRKRHTRRSSVAPRSTCRSRGFRGCSTRRNRFVSSARSALTVECSARSIASPGSFSDSRLANARRTQ